MRIRGNYVLLFVVQLFSGLLTYYACSLYDLAGVAIGFVPFLVALVAVQANYLPDERERGLIYKTDTTQGIVVAVVMALTYMFFPELNWFYIFISSISVVRGIAGTVFFITG